MKIADAGGRDGQAVAEVISGWTGIPIGKMVADEINAVLNLSTTLRERVLGQDRPGINFMHRTSRAGRPMKRPIGVFLLVGHPVSAKRKLLSLAESLYGGERI